jgi:hypothetical protein
MAQHSTKALVQLALCTLSAIVGAGVYFTVKRIGTHLVVNDAHLWGLTIAIFVYLCQFLFASRSLRKAKGVSYNTRLGLILIASASLGSSIWIGLTQIKRGYPALSESALETPDVLGKHFRLDTDVNPKRAYEMSGDMGGFKLIPALSYGSRVLVMLPAFPQSKKIRVTGKLRTDIRTVQRSKDGKIEGPFLQIYREDMGLSSGAKVMFLDTSSRAGLNFTIVIWLLLSLYVLLYGIRMIPMPVHRTTIKFKR